MPMSFGLFEFASPPRTATTWIRHAAVAAGLKELNRNSVHVPHARNGNGKDTIKLSCVRHPCSWLQSYHASIYPGKIGVECVDCFSLGIAQSNFDQWIRCLLAEEVGAVGGMIASYNSDVVIRVEDLPWAFVELLESLGVPRSMRERCLNVPVMNQTVKKQKPEWNPSLKDRVLAAEIELLERYEY